MFTIKLQTRYAVVYRILLIAVMLFNALAPSAATAASLSPSISEKDNLSSGTASNSYSSKGAETESPSLLSSRTTFQDVTPTVSVTNTEAPTPEPSVTATIETTPTPVETLISAATLEPSVTPTPTITQNASGTATQTSTATGQPPVLTFKLSAAPEQAAPGDEVTFTIEVTNIGKTPATGLLFSNILPQHFGSAQGGFKDFNYDPQTRLLTWSGDQAGVPTLAPEQKLSLTYTVIMDAQLDEVQLVDSATFNAGGLSEPMLAEATLTLLSPQKELTMLDPQVVRLLG